MNPFRIAMVTVLLALSLPACGGAGTPSGGSHTAYEKICRSTSMTTPAAREAFWCWHQVGATSYDEWLTREKADRARSKDVARAPIATSTP